VAKKQLYFNEAERLYVVEHCTIADISSACVSEKKPSGSGKMRATGKTRDHNF
jgi:hypothetical protein